MKQNILKTRTLLSVALLLIVSVNFLACSGGGGGIYATVEREVKLNNKSIAGNIVYRMTHFGGNLYVCDGSLYTKGASAGPGWAHVAVSNAPGHIVSVASNSSHIYVLAVGENDIGTVYASTDGTNYTTTGLSGDMNSGCALFDNKAKDSVNRVAYFNNGGTVYQLSGATYTTISTNPANAKGAAYWNGTTEFHSSEAITANSNETGGWRSTDLVVDDGKTPATNLWGPNIKALTYYTTYLFAGFDPNHYNGGYTPYNLSTGHPDTSLTNPSQGGFSGSDILFLRNINGVIYMSVYTQPSARSGLWSYYPGDSNWNLE